MSGFLGLVPMVRLRLLNLALKAAYPSDGLLEAVVDTGYEGFVAVPNSVFSALRLDEMRTLRATVEVADGRKVSSKVAYGTVKVEGMRVEVDGPVETVEGLSEVLVGVRLLSEFRVTLDYCLRMLSVDPCSASETSDNGKTRPLPKVKG